MFVLPRQITKVEKIVFGYAESQHNMTCNLRGRMNAECDIRCSHLKDEWWTYTILLLSQRYFHKMECWQILQTGYPNRIQGLILLSCYFILYLVINCIISQNITQALFFILAYLKHNKANHTLSIIHKSIFDAISIFYRHVWYTFALLYMLPIRLSFYNGRTL